MVVRLLAVPLKKSYEVDLGGPLRSYIASAYSTEDCPTDSEAINEFCRLRSKACCVQHDKQEGSLEILYRYYDQLVALEGKLPLTCSQIPVPFKWKEAFERSLFGKASLTITSGSYEKACVLFNIAALQSQVAALQRLESDDELKVAARLLQSSASIFAYLKDHIMTMVQQEPTADLMPETLHSLSMIMLAQAQEMFYMKASKEVKPSLIAKIASECASMYYDANKILTREGLKSMLDKEWIVVTCAKCFAFQALAQYHQSFEAKEAKEIGEELARLQYADELMGMAQEKLSSTNGLLFHAEKEAIRKAHLAAKKDNDFIYHERVPNIKAVSPIQKMPIAKINPMPATLSARHRDLFEKLVPISVQQAVACFDVRKSEVVNREINKLREYTNMLNDLLASLNLPTAVEDVCRPEALPESIREKSTKIKSMGELKALENLVNELPLLYKRNSEILDETCRLLKEEKTSDQQLRDQFGDKWTRMSSDTLTPPLWLEMDKSKQVLEEAKKADGIIRQKFNDHYEGILLLSKPEAELKNAIPVLAGMSTMRNSPIVVKLQELMDKVKAIKKQREDMENGFRNTTFDMTSEFLKVLPESSVIPEEEISTEHLDKKFSPLIKAVAQSVVTQEQLTDQILAANEQFVKERGADGSVERENALRKLSRAYDAFLELHASIKEGTQFYNDMTPLVLRLQQKVSDFCFARKTEKDDLMRDLQKNIINQPTQLYDQDVSKSQKPPRPPPPSVPSESGPVLRTIPRQTTAPPSAPGFVVTQQYLPYPMAPNFYATFPGAVSTGYTVPYPTGPTGYHPLPQQQQQQQPQQHPGYQPYPNQQ